MNLAGKTFCVHSSLACVVQLVDFSLEGKLDILVYKLVRGLARTLERVEVLTVILKQVFVYVQALEKCK